ncbi:MAG: M3 family metallopeptidase [Woeseiaceae bacterium]
MHIRCLLAFCSLCSIAACGRSDAPDATAAPAVRYAVVDLAQLDTAEGLTARCAAEVTRLREHLEALERYTGQASIDGYLESVNSLNASQFNMSSAAQSLGSVHPDKAVRDAGDECAQNLARVATDISLSRPLFDAASRIDLSHADAVTQHSVAKMLLGFRLSGVDKDETTRERIRALNDEIVAIGQEFDRNIRDDVRYLELESADDLAGLPDDYVAGHQADENGRIRISTQYPDVFPFLEYAESDALRKEMMMLFLNRGYPQNEEVLSKLLAARHELAGLIGYDSYAELVIADKMAGSPEKVASFIDELRGYTVDTQDREYEVLLARLREEQPGADRVERWQASYIQGKVRREQFDVDSKVVREYFNYDDTREGIFTLVQDLFGVRIEPWDTHTWHEDVKAYALFDGDEELGRFYLDMHPREGKFQHAAMFPFVNGIEGRQLPVAGLICNFPSGGDAMQHSQVITFLHEFGHLIHWLFAGHHRWHNVSGINTEWDFVEAPSQMLEEWVWDFDTISRFARNKDGETIPRDLLDRMVAARDFGLGIGTRQQLNYAALSLELYRSDPAAVDVAGLARHMEREYTLFEPVEGTHYYAAFGHLNGYSAIYYTYQWSLAIATDMLTRFEEAGLRDIKLAKAYRDKVLAAGGTRPAAELVSDFLGRDISFKPYADRLAGSAGGR